MKYKHRSANLELITIIECISADGKELLPGFVFEGQQYDPEWFKTNREITYVLSSVVMSLSDARLVNDGNSIGVSPNGWTDDFLCLKWFEKTFVPQATARNTSGKPILLIYDGHGSHNSAELIRLARANNIILFCLPPHTTHKLQPLDVGVFGPFQNAWIE